jgi:tetratricopeptide (TPR) repeat protein
VVFVAFLSGLAGQALSEAAAQRPASSAVIADRDGEAEVRLHEGLLAYQQRDLRAAEASFRGVLERYPDDTEARYFLGLIFAETDRDTEALAAFNRVLASDAEFAPAQAARAAALIRAGQYDQPARTSTCWIGRSGTGRQC